MNATKSASYRQPSIGCYLDHANYSPDELSAEIIGIAVSLGYELSSEDAELLAMTEDEIAEICDYSQCLYELSEGCVNWLNEQEQRPFLYWANEGEANAFGLWPSVESAKEDVGFVSDRKQEYPADDYEGEWLHVSDHGNATLYSRSNGKDVEIWSVV